MRAPRVAVEPKGVIFFCFFSSLLSPQSSVLSPVPPRFPLHFLLPLQVAVSFAASGCRFWLPFLVAVSGCRFARPSSVCQTVLTDSLLTEVTCVHPPRYAPPSVVEEVGFFTALCSQLTIRVHPWFKKLVFSLLTIHVHPYPSVVEEVGFSLFTGVSHVT